MASRLFTRSYIAADIPTQGNDKTKIHASDLKESEAILPQELLTDEEFDFEDEDFLGDEEFERLPAGGLSKGELLDRILRVDHAGEFGADRIYNGQHFVLQNSPVSHIIRVTNFILLFVYPKVLTQ